MKRIAFGLIIIGVLGLQFAFSQENRKSIAAVRIDQSIKIDGVLDEDAWLELPMLTDFIQFEPYNGKPASLPTLARVGYDDEALYIGAVLSDPAPDSILTGQGKRDDHDDINADLFLVNVGPFNDGLNSMFFCVSASGVQSDRALSSSGEDENWNAVWDSAVRLTADGWIVEIRIPYSALRFPDKQVQDWGFNVCRHIKRYAEWSGWSPISNEIPRWWSHSGILEGLRNIDPPLRLSIMPYTSGYVENNTENEWGYSYNGGMDLKWGINESFTLDLTLIPDFGQVQSDDEVLNLTPFEIQYDEKRQFFTEGTELFNKGGIFYSRRIGATPSGFESVGNSLGTSEKIVKNPGNAQLLNATKLSGRLRNGLGIGVFNAMTARTEATILDTVSQAELSIVTEPFRNYNLVVLDQSLWNNSYISLINTNVKQKDYSANVTATEFGLADRKNIFAVNGGAALSRKLYPDSTDSGFRYNIKLGKISGKLQYDYEFSLESDTYDPNDMGYRKENNEFEQQLSFEYNIYAPFGRFRNWYNNLYFYHKQIYKPRNFSEFVVNYVFQTRLKNNDFAEMHFGWRPNEAHDYFEPRVRGRSVIYPRYFHICSAYDTDERKFLSLELFAGITKPYEDTFDRFSYHWGFEPKLRMSDRLVLSYEFYQQRNRHDTGYVNRSADNATIWFGQRNYRTLEQQIEADYIFTNKASLNFRLRHYWSTADYEKYYLLEQNGRLTPAPGYNANHDINYNAFTIDMVFTWNFAPGSEMLIVWKNAIFTDTDQIRYNYFNDLRDTIEAAQINSFSVKILYYLDYLKLRRFF